MQKVTVTFIDPFDGYREDYAGALMGEKTAIYIGAESGEVFLGNVVPTAVSGVYLTDSEGGFLNLGVAQEDHNVTLDNLAQVMQGMTAMEFIKKVLLHVEEQIEFADLIVPGLIKNN